MTEPAARRRLGNRAGAPHALRACVGSPSLRGALPPPPRRLPGSAIATAMQTGDLYEHHHFSNHPYRTTRPPEPPPLHQAAHPESGDQLTVTVSLPPFRRSSSATRRSRTRPPMTTGPAEDLGAPRSAAMGCPARRRPILPLRAEIDLDRPPAGWTAAGARSQLPRRAIRGE